MKYLTVLFFHLAFFPQFGGAVEISHETKSQYISYALTAPKTWFSFYDFQLKETPMQFHSALNQVKALKTRLFSPEEIGDLVDFEEVYFTATDGIDDLPFHCHVATFLTIEEAQLTLKMRLQDCHCDHSRITIALKNKKIVLTKKFQWQHPEVAPQEEEADPEEDFQNWIKSFRKKQAPDEEKEEQGTTWIPAKQGAPEKKAPPGLQDLLKADGPII